MSNILNYVKSGLLALEEDLIEGIEGNMVGNLRIWKDQIVSNRLNPF